MNTEVKQFLDEAATVGRIKAYADSIVTGLSKGLKRSAPERRATWQQIIDEATKCRDGIAPGVKPRAKRQNNGTPTILERQAETKGLTQ